MWGKFISGVVAPLLHRFAKWKDKDPFIIREYEYGKSEKTAYLIRYRLIHWSWLRLYVHEILRSDKDRHLHNHPWTFWSLVLKNGYIEHCEDYPRRRRPGSIVYRPADTYHRVELFRTEEDCNMQTHERPALTLVLAGSKTREWGFYTDIGYIPNYRYEEYLKYPERFGPFPVKEEAET